MFIYSVKAQNLKFAGSLLLSAIAIVLVLSLIPSRAEKSLATEESVQVIGTVNDKSFRNISTNEARVAFLKNYGWEVESEAVEVGEITIPSVFDSVYSRYNEMQKAQNLDLEKYKGKTVMQYRYVVTNYEYNGTVLATLLIYKDRVIGGEISSSNIDGFVHGFARENVFSLD